MKSFNIAFPKLLLTEMNNFLIFIFIFIQNVHACPRGEILNTLKPKYAEHFKVEYYKNGKLFDLDGKLFWQSSDKCDLFKDKPMQMVPVKVDRMVITSSTHLAQYQAIETNQKAVVLFAPQREYFYNKSAINSLKYPLRNEELLMIKPDVVMIYPLGPSEYELERRLIQGKMNFIYNLDYLEKSPLGRAEWMKFQSALLTTEKAGRLSFERIDKSYHATKNQNQFLKKKKLKVIVGSFENGKWALPGGESDLAQLIVDAGGDYVGKEFSGRNTRYLDREKIQLLSKDVDVWLVHNNWLSLQEANDYSFLKMARKFNYNARTNGQANDYWESGMVRVDLLLSDLKSIMQNKKSHLNFYREL